MNLSPLIILVIGKPGSGKSTFIEALVSKFEVCAATPFQIFNDRDVLVKLAHTNTMSDFIRALDDINFEIVDDKAYDIAIDEVVSAIHKAKDHHLLLVEFSRNNYLRALRKFADLFDSNNFLIVYVETAFEICKKRNLQRAVQSNSHCVPTDEMDSYFQFDDLDQLIPQYQDRLMVIDNESVKSDLHLQIDELWPALISPIYKEKTYDELSRQIAVSER